MSAEGRRSVLVGLQTLCLKLRGPLSEATSRGCSVERADTARARCWPRFKQLCTESLSAMKLLLRHTCLLETGDLGLEAGVGK